MIIPNDLIKKEKLIEILTKPDIEFYYALKGYNFEEFKRIYDVKKQYDSTCLFLEDFNVPEVYTINHDKTAIITIPLSFKEKEIIYSNLNDNSIELQIRAENKLYFFTIYKREFLVFKDSYEAYYFFKEQYHVRFV